MFRFRCSNCGSTDVEIYKDRNGYGKDYLNCRCGWQYYGLEKIAALYREQKDDYDQRSAQDLILARKEARRARERAAKIAKERQAKVIELSSKLCAWGSCDKGTRGGRAVKRESSKYCSRDCSNRNARHRYRLRAKKEAA